MRESVKVGLATTIFALVHSALASNTVKQFVSRIVGQQQANAIYRLFYNAQSLVTFGLLVSYGATLSTRVLYHVRGPLAILMRLGQATGLLYIFWAAWQIGITRLSGLKNLLAWLLGKDVSAVPIAQGPELREDGQLSIGGPFLWSRHPLNFAPIPLFWLTPRMTARRLAFNLVSTAYLVLGSLHEETRLRRAYGRLYEQYQRSGVPFYWPRIPRHQQD